MCAYTHVAVLTSIRLDRLIRWQKCCQSESYPLGIFCKCRNTMACSKIGKFIPETSRFNSNPERLACGCSLAGPLCPALIIGSSDPVVEDLDETCTALAQDTLPPMLSLIGSETISVFQCQSFEDPGVIAIDNADDDIADKVQVTGTFSGNTQAAASFIILYDVTGLLSFPLSHH